MSRKLLASMAVVAMLLLSACILAVGDQSKFAPTIPVMSIETDKGTSIESKEIYVRCTIDVSNTDGEHDLESVDGKIRGRGNSTWDVPSYWYMPKKPYRVSFDQPVDLFGNGSATDWTLIANYTDQSLTRNAAAYAVGRAVEAPYTTTAQCVDLYLNGVFQGLYLVCEQVEIGENRVDIEKDYTVLDTGYLIEMDVNAYTEKEAGRDYFVMSDDAFGERAYKIRDTGKQWTQDNFDFIEGVFGDAWAALHSGIWTDTASHIDTDSFARTYIVNELFNTQDVTDASFFMYRPVGGTIHSGPIWDFDNSSGNATNLKSKDPGYMWAAETNPWYAALLEYPEFRTLVGSLLAEKQDAIRDAIDSETGYALSHPQDYKKNFEKWPVRGALVGSNPLEFLVIDEWSGHVHYLRDWLYASLDSMTEVYCSS